MANRTSGINNSIMIGSVHNMMHMLQSRFSNVKNSQEMLYKQLLAAIQRNDARAG